MPCVNLSSYSLANSIIPGNDEIGTGTSTQRDVPLSFYYRYSYYGQFLNTTQLTNIPDGASIYRIEWEYEILTDATYTRADSRLILFQVPSSNTRFSTTQQQVNGYSGNDATWNNSITNYVNVKNNFTYSLTKSSFEPNIRWRGTTLTTPYVFNKSNCLCVLFKTDDGDYYLNASTYPRILTTFGTNNSTVFGNRKDGSAYAEDDIVNYQASYTPNIRIYYN